MALEYCPISKESWKFERVRIGSNRDEPDRSVLNRGKSDGLFLQQTKACLTTPLHVTKSNTWRKPRDETADRSFIPFLRSALLHQKPYGPYVGVMLSIYYVMTSFSRNLDYLWS